jgi:hypothetical protein
VLWYRTALNSVLVRVASKYRHLFGKDEQQRNCFNNVNVG